MVRRKRIRWSKADLEQLDQQVVDALKKSRPQSVRHVFYLMTNPRLPCPVEKTDDGYKRVQRRCVELRRAGHVPYDWIVDMTRRGHHTPTYDSPAVLIRHHAHGYRVDPWPQTDHCVEVWTESRSIAGVIEATCREYAVSLYPSGGFASLSLGFEAAEHVLQMPGDRPVEVIYIGDYDPAGVLIDLQKSIMKELHNHLGGGLALHRIAITQEQIAQYDLPTKPRKESEQRRRDIEETVEAEAMPVELLLGLLRQKLDAFLPDGALEKARERERRTRNVLVTLADLIDESGLSEVIGNHLRAKLPQKRDAESDDEAGSDSGGGSSV